MKKYLTIIGVLALSAAVFAGCNEPAGGGAEATTGGAAATGDAADTAAATPTDDGPAVMSAPGVFPIVDRPVHMDIVMPDVPYIGVLNDNAFAAWYEEKTGVVMNFIEVPSDHVTERVNLMLAAGDLPDIFMNTVVDADLNGPRGIFIPLNDLIDSYGLETPRIFSENDGLPGMITHVDGNIYALPNINDCFHCRRTFRAWINTDWLDEFNLDMPQTTDEFEHVLRTWRDAGRIPMSAAGTGGPQQLAWPFLLNSFMYFHQGLNQYMYLDNGTVNFAAFNPEFREGLRWIRHLVEDGLIEPMALTQTGDQLLQLGADPSGPQVGIAPSFVWWQMVPGDDVSPDLRSRSFEALSPLQGPRGVRISPLTHRAAMRDFVVITSAAERPDVAFRWLDGLYSLEVTMRSQLGEPEIGWTEAPAGSVGINGLPALYTQLWFESDADALGANTRMDNIMLADRSSPFRLGEMADWDDPETMFAQEPRLFRITNEFYEPFAHDYMSVPPLAFSEAEQDALGLINPQIHDHMMESITLFLSGGLCLDNDWDGFIATLYSIGVEDYVGIRQIAFDRQFGN
ncbi:MAG: extracellular solute-binding protein [Defluviitaleaceae bacterium]|nr:extracellular solute-binding protein [Defluviitaleaceae bacterium]